MTAILFWSAVALIAYTFAGYPVLLAVWSRMRPRRVQQRDSEPKVSIVISAYDEAELIIEKIRNLLSLDYPADRIEILVGSDGSTDGTAEKLAAFDDDRVHVFVFKQRRGKPAVLNTLIPRATGDIVVLSDVRQTFTPGVLRAFARSFGDPRVGAVSGQVILTTDGTTSVSEGSGLYWRYETFIRTAESIVDSTITMTGPIYAIRKGLFEPIPADTIIDDVLIPVRITRRGYRTIVEPAARAIDRAYTTAGQEFTRKVRTLAGNFQLFARERWLLDPFRNRLWLQTMSHKALRLFVAPLQVAIVALNAVLLPSAGVYEIVFLAQLAFYAGALAGCVLPRRWKRPLFVTVPFVFCLLSFATVLAFLRSVTGRQPVTWQKATANSPR